jgi:hypothetical protein
LLLAEFRFRRAPIRRRFANPWIGPHGLVDGVVNREHIACKSRRGSCTQSDSYEKDALHFCPNPLRNR